ncbi:hypothetical protein ACNKHO_05525 [Shigella flexneri]
MILTTMVTTPRPATAGSNYTYGGWADGSSPSDIQNSKLVVLFGNNPGETRMSRRWVNSRSGTGAAEIERAHYHRRSTLYRYLAGREDERIPIRPVPMLALVSRAGVGDDHGKHGRSAVPRQDLRLGYDDKTLPGAPAHGHYKAYILGAGQRCNGGTPGWSWAL